MRHYWPFVEIEMRNGQGCILITNKDTSYCWNRGVWLANRCKNLGFVIKEFWKVKGHPVKGKNCTLNGVVCYG